MPSQINANPVRAVDSSGDLRPGAKLYAYESGTTTILTLYTDSSLGTAHPRPLVADAYGMFAPIWVSGTVGVKINITDASGTELPGYPIDPVQLVPNSGSAAAQVSFVPVTGNSGTTVQAAIQNNTNQLNDITSFGWSLLDDASASAGRSTLGLTSTATAPFLDEDGMASDSATSVASQQSIKAYVDNQLARGEATAATTSGTEVNISTAIPAGVMWIEVLFAGVSLSGTNDILVQLSTGSSFVTTGYVSASGRGDAVSHATAVSTSGLIVNASSGSNAFSGLMTLQRSSSSTFRWAAHHGGYLSGTAGAWGGGEINLGGILDGIRVKSTGANTFDAGNVYIRWGK